MLIPVLFFSSSHIQHKLFRLILKVQFFLQRILVWKFVGCMMAEPYKVHLKEFNEEVRGLRRDEELIYN